MRSYQSDLSRRLGSVFAEYAAQPKTLSDRNLPHPQEGPKSGRGEVFPAQEGQCLSKAYKPTHGGYPSAGARA